MTTGDVLDAAGQTAFETWIAGGGNYVGVHSAADTEYDWPFYGQLVGAYFKQHPAAIQPAAVKIEVTDHPATAGLPSAWMRTDEWYDFQTNPRATVTVLATVDESTYTGGTMGADHPIVWTHTTTGGGRALYTAMGHTMESLRGAAIPRAPRRRDPLGGRPLAAASLPLAQRHFKVASFARSSWPTAALMSSTFTLRPFTSAMKRPPTRTLISPRLDRVSYFSNALLPPSTVDFS